MMLTSLSNDRKVILKSAVIGTTLIGLLSCVLMIREAFFLWFIGFVGIAAVYLFIPTWLSRNRQLEKREVKHFTPEGVEIKKFNIPEYQYFNADGEKVDNWSPREKFIALPVSIAINLILSIILGSRQLSTLADYFPSYETLFILIPIFFFLAVPYLVRHIFCFNKDLPMDTSFFALTNDSSFTPRLHSSASSISLNRFTSGKYAYLPYNSNRLK